MLFPFEPHYLMLENGARIHYVDEGNGPVILLLHGNPTWSFLYRKIIDALKEDFRLIAPDYPGFGLSTAPQPYEFTAAEQAASMQEFVQKLGLDDMMIMVQDWGGPIGFGIAVDQPERVHGFIIGNTWAWPLERSGHKLFSTIMGGWTGQFYAWCCNGIVDFFMTQGVEQPLAPEVYAMYEAPFAQRASRTPTYVFPAQLWDAQAYLGHVYAHLPVLSDKPALIVWGTQDFAFKTPERERFETLFPNHKTVLLETASHFIQEDAAEEITEEIRFWYQALRL